MKKRLPLNLFLDCRRWIAVIASLGFFLLDMQQAMAQQTTPHPPRMVPDKTFSVTAGTTFTYDSNVFRLSPLVNPIALTGQPRRADQIIITSATLGFNKRYSMQRFEVTGTLVDNRYMNFDFLDFLGKNYNAAWHWYVTPYLHGRLTSRHSEALNNFANLSGFLNGTNRNLRTLDNYHFDGVLELNRAWHLIGGLDHSIMKNSRLTIQDFNNKVTSVEGGIRYVSSSGGSLTYRVRSGRGEFINRPAPLPEFLFDTRFDEMEHDLRMHWPVTVKTSIEGRIGYLDRKHAHFSQRDFAGFVGDLNISWMPTSKVQVMGGWSRQLSNYQTAPFAFQHSIFERFSSSYIATNRFSIAPTWQITEKTALRVRYDYVLSDFHGAVVPLPTESRSDQMHSGLVALDWRPLNTLYLSAAFHRDHRSSNHRGFGFDSTAGSVSATLNF
ncbi:exopolysaccharide biosynthesis operon protein EpsL [Nitrosospira multiformis ATCC 25196]|uniref:Exopolysaccharide biosynthesis operon protein EpsL n=2 Tax=Nitrosospira multiformis TaxID=1231 RepID=A0A1H5V2I7_NITMU|nr:exopolysaccharide biosynthesis operon protein EpsL [Nitrosospira multiformis]SEF81483.1 exopolysaccharide biosynthesis operon protein EpsL [Nitrosospira multiformis ATCC 25196]